MKFKLLFVLLIITALVSSGLFYLWTETRIFYSDLIVPQNIAPIINSVKIKPAAIEKEVIVPLPLKATYKIQNSVLSNLSKEGVVYFTNKYRLENDLTPLKENILLNIAAENKVKDMFENQYFGHKSPSGLDAGSFVEGAGYSFIMVGENLAEGNFENDEILVQAWMDSPGHRANILHKKFTEIGVSAKKGLWDGRLTWVAVQEFALPLSTCPQVDESLVYTIKTNRDKINVFNSSLHEKKREIDTLGIIQFLEYNRKVDEYNNLVVEYNGLIEETKVLVNVYNSQVSNFNTCFNNMVE